jgi:hypothetical protein
MRRPATRRAPRPMIMRGSYCELDGPTKLADGARGEELWLLAVLIQSAIRMTTFASIPG